MSRQKSRKNRGKSEDEEEIDIDTEVNEIIESGGSRY
jgi:hypothetical protein